MKNSLKIKSYFKTTWIELLAISVLITIVVAESMKNPLTYIVLNHFNITEAVLGETVKNFEIGTDPPKTLIPLDPF